ncbi:hypothetical protein [Oligella urethralis]|uniref:hypothetical protein n=1 Tax=Oligella urethralis TaxID=90245 RepID=UPI000E0E2774|nr:hypothetical protein [Oligella urethralis]
MKETTHGTEVRKQGNKPYFRKFEGLLQRSQFLIRNRDKIIFDSEINKQKNIGEIIKKELNQPLNN